MPGKQEHALVGFEFRHQGRAALKNWMENASGKTDAALLAEVVIGWDGVADKDGNDVPFSVEHLNELLDMYPASPQEIMTGYVLALTESRAKN